MPSNPKVPVNPVAPALPRCADHGTRTGHQIRRGRGLVEFGVGIRRPAGLALCLLATVLFVSGCTTSLGEWWHNGFKVGPQYCRPNAPFAENWLDSGDTRLKTEPAQDCAWWTVFNDSVLNGLIEAAYRQNLDLKAAGSRILESRAQRNIAIGNLFPQSQTALADYAGTPS